MTCCGICGGASCNYTRFDVSRLSLANYESFKEWATNLEILDTTHDPESIDVTAPDYEFAPRSDE